MEDYGYTFDDLSNMTQGQLMFLIKSKVERMKAENEAVEKANKEAAKKHKGARGGATLGPKHMKRRRN